MGNAGAKIQDYIKSNWVMYLESSSISFFLFPCWVWEDIYQSRPLRSCARWIHQHNMISGKQRRGRAGRVERFQWYSTKLRQFLYGDANDSPEDVEYTHEFIPNFHGYSWIIFRQIVAFWCFLEFWFTKTKWQFQRWRSGRKGGFSLGMFGASKSQDGSICKPCVTWHCSTFHHVSFYFIIWHDILLHCTVYSTYVCM